MAGAMNALEAIAACGVLPVVVLDDAGAAPSLGDALLSGGLPCVEITFRTSAAADGIARLAGDPRLTVGGGTILEPAQVDRAVAAGARFIVSPGFDAAIVRRCRELDVAVIPGIATATEAMVALGEGAHTVKLFPAQTVGGLAMVSALAAPFPSLRFVPTGGIGPRELPEYIRHPAVLAVGGSWIAPRALVNERRFREIARLAAEAAMIVAAERVAA
jgi:2-dehydro-3-deoxyphosphogluconate aldolase / (4S)-4-hydroxy-2-oxoglutarate aldolase